jgi:hypothetical protein
MALSALWLSRLPSPLQEGEIHVPRCWCTPRRCCSWWVCCGGQSQPADGALKYEGQEHFAGVQVTGVLDPETIQILHFLFSGSPVQKKHPEKSSRLLARVMVFKKTPAAKQDQGSIERVADVFIKTLDARLWFTSSLTSG